MTKKISLVLSVICALFLSSTTVFAVTNEMREGMNNAGNEMSNSWNKLGDTVQNAGNAVASGVSTLMGTNDNNSNNNQNSSGSYTATRTSTDAPGTYMGMNSTMWTWLIFGVLGIMLVSLVWYYGKERDELGHRHE